MTGHGRVALASAHVAGTYRQKADDFSRSVCCGWLFDGPVPVGLGAQGCPSSVERGQGVLRACCRSSIESRAATLAGLAAGSAFVLSGQERHVFAHLRSWVNLGHFLSRLLALHLRYKIKPQPNPAGLSPKSEEKRFYGARYLQKDG